MSGWQLSLHQHSSTTAVRHSPLPTLADFFFFTLHTLILVRSNQTIVKVIIDQPVRVFFFSDMGAEKLPDQKGPQLCGRQYSVSLFHGHRPPVVITVK